jgi:hypothetical protein
VTRSLETCAVAVICDLLSGENLRALSLGRARIGRIGETAGIRARRAGRPQLTGVAEDHPPESRQVDDAEPVFSAPQSGETQ